MVARRSNVRRACTAAGVGLGVMWALNAPAAGSAEGKVLRPLPVQRLRPLQPALPTAGSVATCAHHSVNALPDHLPFGPGEFLEYQATLKGLPAGTVQMRVLERTQRGGRTVYPLQVTAEGNPVVNVWARMKATATSWLDPDTSLPVAFASRTVSEKFTYLEDVTFLGAGHPAAVRTLLNDKPWDRALPVEGDPVDSLALLYYARSRNFAVGQPFCFDLYQSRLIWRVRGAVVRTETLDTDAGPFSTFVAAGEARAVGPVKGLAAQPRPFTAWMTADGDRIPVQLVAPSPLGPITARLVRFEQGRRLVRASAR